MGLADLFFPRRCPECGELLPFGAAYCTCHATDVRRVDDDFCEHCGAAKQKCACTSAQTRRLQHVCAPYLYAGAAKDDLRTLKFHGRRQLAKPLGRQMALRFAVCFPNAAPDCVTFVPMTKRAKAERGFNQSELLARVAAKHLNRPCVPLLRKTNETRKQHELSAAERVQNLNGAFRLTDGFNVAGKTVLLCDDIKTTGATLFACEQALLLAGAKDVYCLACAVSDYGTPF